MELRIARSAVEDLRVIQQYYVEQDVPHVGYEYVAAILEHAALLKRHPDAGRIVPEFKQGHIRELIHPPCRVVYLRQADEVVVIRVWRSERLLDVPQDAT